MVLYQPNHESQYAPGCSPVTRSSGCTWTSGATGADASSGGRKDRTPDYIHSLVKLSEERNPKKPGWSLPDLALAMKRLGVGFEVRSGQGWAAVTAAHAGGHYIVLQGDSDQFGNETCSGKFDGDHCIGIRPVTTSPGGKWLIDDPICPTDRYENPVTLRRYAEKLYVNVLFGVFTDRVPQMPTPKPGWVATVHGRTSLYDAHGNVVGAVTKATYRTAERVKLQGAWRFRIVRLASGKPTRNAGKYLPAASTVTYTRP
jgi:hypothetical protein